MLYHFHFGAGPRVLVRVDIDALPIQEVNTFDHRSEINGVSHKCGHDGHTVIGIGLVERLVHAPLEQGQISILFQPAEETGEGARNVLDDAEFDIRQYDFAIALHNIPGYPLHEVLWKKKQFTTAVQSVIFRFTGKTTHAAQPQQGKNPAVSIAELLTYARNTQVLNEQDLYYHLITPIYLNMGSQDYGVAAGYGEVHFTIRSRRQAHLEEITADFINFATKVARKEGVLLETETLAAFAASRNHPVVVEQLIEAAQTLGLHLTKRAVSFPWGEDFGLFTQKIPGAMFGLGGGEKLPALHNPDYDFPDEIIPTGVNLFYETAKKLTQHQQNAATIGNERLNFG